MSLNNYSFNIYEKIDKDNRSDWKLYIDAVYKADPEKKNISAEVLSKLLGVKNQGGFRYLGKTEEPKLIVLYTTGDNIFWKDEMDSSMGVLVYYGDNKVPGTDLHKTNLHGNEILRYIFNLAISDDIEKRKKIPPILVFKKSSGRDVKFLGLAVPGIRGRPSKEWLTAVWGCNKNGDRFQNYKAYFSILNTSSGSELDSGFGINLAWLNDIELGNAFDSQYAPYEWKNYINNKRYLSLITKIEKFVKTKEEQLPSDKVQYKMLETMQQFFIKKDNGFSFEVFAADFTQYIDKSVLDVNVTRGYKDGGLDAIGRYRIFSDVENIVSVEFYLQAKCYSMDNSVKVQDTSRLISRIKNRQFGIMFTTSYIAKQAYEEILADGHPIVIINGKNIIDFIFYELEIRDVDSLIKYLELNYGS